MKYKGKTPVKKGDWVELWCLDEDGQYRAYEKAKVVDALAKQFTCKVPYDKHIRFYFYEDEGVTWGHV